MRSTAIKNTSTFDAWYSRPTFLLLLCQWLFIATGTAYFVRPNMTPSTAVIETIKYNLEQLDGLSFDELELLKRTTDSLIEFVELHQKVETEGWSHGH